MIDVDAGQIRELLAAERLRRGHLASAVLKLSMRDADGVAEVPFTLAAIEGESLEAVCSQSVAANPAPVAPEAPPKAVMPAPRVEAAADPDRRELIEVDEPAAGTRPKQMLAAWRRWNESGRSDQAAYQEISQHILYIARVASRQMALGRSILDSPDLVQEGVIAGLEALGRFDTAVSDGIYTFISARVRGGMLDVLREASILPRGILKRTRDYYSSHDALAIQMGRVPTMTEVVTAIEGSCNDRLLAKYRDALELRNKLAVVASIDELIFGDGNRIGIALQDTLADDQPQAIDAIVDRDSRHELESAIASLPDRERMIVSMYYTDGMTLSEIGGQLGVTESRISQIHSKAVDSLRRYLSNIDESGKPARAATSRRARRSTPERDAEMARLYETEQKTFTAIATRFDVNINTVRNAVSRAIAARDAASR